MYRIKSNHALYKMKMLSQLGTNRLTDQLLELLEWLFATKNVDILLEAKDCRQPVLQVTFDIVMHTVTTLLSKSK